MRGLEIQDVSIEIKGNKLLENVSIMVEKGTIMALVGHNGAGKSTLMKIIIGILEKTSGKIVLNQTVDQDDSFMEFKQSISYLPEEPLLLTELTVMQHFQLYGKSYQIAESELSKKIGRLLEGFELKDKLNEYPESLSKGMRQKVQAICAFLPDVPLLLIDEPFMGLDIYAIEYMESLIKEKAEDGATILLTTHQLDRVKNIANQFTMLQQGRVLNKGHIEEFETITRRTDNER